MALLSSPAGVQIVNQLDQALTRYEDPPIATSGFPETSLVENPPTVSLTTALLVLATGCKAYLKQVSTFVSITCQVWRKYPTAAGLETLFDFFLLLKRIPDERLRKASVAFIFAVVVTKS